MCEVAMFIPPEQPPLPVSAGNTFQDLPRLPETADNTDRYILRDIRVRGDYYIRRVLD
jgi:hypothetical protein